MAREYLKAGDEVVADFVHFVIDERHMFINPFIGDSDLWHDGSDVHRDEESGQLYIEVE